MVHGSKVMVLGGKVIVRGNEVMVHGSEVMVRGSWWELQQRANPFPRVQQFFELVFSHHHRIPKAGSQFWGGACISSALVRLYGGLYLMAGAIQGWRDCITRLIAR